MIIAFKIILFALIAVFGMGTIAEDEKASKQVYGSIVIASIIALVVSFIVL
jgi:hypothetical protein